MGKKKRTSTSVTNTVKTKVVKLTYLQTLAVSDQMLSVSDLETDQYTSSPQSSSSRERGYGLPVLGIGKKKKKATSVFETTGVKIKDQWLQPYFDKISYKIGVKELSVSSYLFAEASEFVSVPFKSPKEIIKVSILVDDYIPPVFSTAVQWMKYFIRVEGEEKWIRVNPLNKPTIFDSDTGLIIPKIINFNVPKPGTAQLEDKFNYTDDPVKLMRFRAVLLRPADNEATTASMTPLLKSYRLTMVPRV